MQIIHRFKNNQIKKNADNVAFILTNKIGSFFIQGLNSRYNGLYFLIDNEHIKIFDEIKVDEPRKIINNFYCVERITKKNGENFFFPYKKNCLVYGLEKEDNIIIDLDVKKIFDNREWGRYYNAYSEDNNLIIEFTKKTDAREDPTNEIEEYKIFIRISKVRDFKIIGWIKKEYDFDIKRQSKPYSRYVYRLCVKAKNLIISLSKKFDELLNIGKLKKLQKKYVETIKLKKLPNDIFFAYISCINSLDSLITDKGIYAGLPWFCEYWIRDILISLKALILQKEYSVVKNNLNQIISLINSDGKVPTKLNGKYSNIDCTGLISHYLYEFLNNQKTYQLDKNQIKAIVDKLNSFIKNYSRGSFIHNLTGETWMDSVYNDSGRQGFRIEIQVLLLCVYRLFHYLTKDIKYFGYEENFRRKIVRNFLTNRMLKDGLDDATIRPNIFLAYYFYPNLLLKRQWSECFDKALDALWLDWGGLATIEKSSNLFQKNYTGEDNKSYHRGDSWFWINNMAALVLYRLDKKRYKDYIDKIIKASINEILWKGAISHHAELSSASELRSEGCLSQAWSSALFIELINAIYFEK